ncbi:MAG: hypothetical protein H7Y11_02670 [Armatimonadetes bacterium]|nr:hypothetical protein [Anaerolineae bacterium]
MIRQLRSFGLTSDSLYLAAFASIIGSIGVWFLQSRDKDDRASAERLGIFVGLWAPTLWAMGNAINDFELAEKQ